MQADREAAGYGIRPLDEDSYARRMYNIGQTYKSAATAGLSEDGLGDTKYFSPKWLAEQGISIAENAPNIALSAINPVLGTAYMVANAGGGRALELTEQGVGTQAAVTRGLISGGIEVLTEKFSIDNLLGALTNNKGVLLNILSQMGVEASEESASYVLNYLADKAAKDPNAQFSWNELLDSAIGGAFSGGIYGGIGQIGRKGAEQAQRTLGENSRKNYEKAKQEDAGRTPDFDRQFDHYNKMGELGIAFDQIPEIASATPVSDTVKQGAYLTGKNDGVERATKLADKALQGETLTDAEIDSVLGHKETRQHFESAAGVKFSQSNAKNRTVVRQVAAKKFADRAVTVYGDKSGLVESEISKQMKAEDVEFIDTLLKATGSKGMITNATSEFANADVENGIVTVYANADDAGLAYRNTVKHEITHRIKELGAKTYGQYENFAVRMMAKSSGISEAKLVQDYQMRYREEANQTMTVAQAREEIASDYAMALRDVDAATVREFVNQSGENRKAAKKVLESIRNMIRAIAERFTKDKLTREQLQMQRELEKAEQLWAKALDEASQIAAKTEVTDGENKKTAQTDGKKFSLKGSVVTYEDLMKKPPLKVVNVKKQLKSGTYAEMRDEIKRRAEEEKWIDEPYYNADTGSLIFLTDKSFSHSFSKLKKTFGEDSIRCMAHIREIIKEAVLVHIADPKDPTKSEKKVYTFFGAIDGIKGIEPVKLTVKEYDSSSMSEVPENIRSYFEENGDMESYNSLYDARALEVIGIERVKKEPDDSGKVYEQGSEARATSDSIISVADLLDLVKGDAEKYLPQKEKSSSETTNRKSIKGTSDYVERAKEYREKYGVIPQGEKAARNVQFPQQTNDDTRVRRFARTAAEASVLSDEQAGAIEQAVLDGVFDYEPIGDQSAVERAEAKILRDAEQAKRDWAAVVNSNDRITKNDIALGELLLKQAAEAGDTQEVIRLTAEIAAAGTQAGQVVQAMRLLKQMGGAGQLAAIDHLTNQYQKDLDKRYGKKAPQLDIPDHLKQDLANAKTEAEIERAKDAIFKHIASQIPSTWGDKWNAWRYLAMLGNPRTHIRNVLGNALFEPMVGVKNVIGAVAEAAVIKDGKERTKTLKPASKATKSFAKADYAEMEEIVKHGGKYNDGQKIDDYRTIFTNKAIEWARKANGKALEKEDGIFLGRHYTRALASYITANNLDVAKLGDGSRESAKLLDKARAYAIREAQKATYRDASQTAELIAQTARRGNAPVRMVLEGVLPFKKTPINILKRGLEYSPAGLVKAVYKGVDGLKNGGYTANEFVDDLAAGLSGSTLLGLGYMMTSMGLLSGGSDDEDESKWFKDMLGYQSYALRAGDTTYTLDWMAPGSMPLFVGVELFNLKHGDELDAKDMLQAMELVTAPLNNMSMLSGLNDTLDNLAYGGDTDNALMNLFTDSVLSYLSQAVPTIGGQVARTMDGTRRTTYADPNNAMPDSWEKALQKAGNKIPYLSEKNPAYINLWGETEETENPLYRFMTNALSPGYVDTIEMDKLDEELLRLYEATGENVFPDSAGKSIRVDNETKKFTVDEFRTYATALGQTSHEVLYGLTDSKMYRNADDADKVAGVDMAYQYARALAKTEVSDYELDGWIAKAHEGATVGLAPEDYILYKLACDLVEAGDSVTQEEAKKAIDSMDGLNKKQKAYLWQSQNKSWKADKNPYK